MRINIDRIPDEGLVVKKQAPVNSFPALKEMNREDGVQFRSPVRMDLKVRRSSGFVDVSGVLQTEVHLECGRCLEEYTQELSTELTATYTEEAPAADDVGQDAEIELTSEVMDQYHFKGNEMDLTEAVQEQILLSLPLRRLCREECKGLCPKCGIDLNKGSCRCGEQSGDTRFSVLRNLKL